MPTKLDELKKEARNQLEFTRKAHGLQAPALEDYSSWLIDRAFQAGVEMERERHKNLLIDAGYAIETIRGYVEADSPAEKHLKGLSRMLLEQGEKDLLTGKGGVL